jgi:hypothetical protein
MSKLKTHHVLLIISIFFAGCFSGDDLKGKIVIEYNGQWRAVITENYTESSHSGTGPETFTCTNPDKLKITAAKLDASLNKLTVYIYEDDRIAAGGSTREPFGSISAEYEFPY